MRCIKELCRFLIVTSLAGFAVIGGPGSLTALAVDESIGNLSPSAVAAGTENTCALFATGDVACWGDNHAGAIGNGTFFTDSNLPIAVKDGALEGNHVSQIDTGPHTCALLTNGKVACWGENNEGQLGTGNRNDSEVPVLVDGGALSSKVVTQIATGTNHTCALIAGGTVSCWGWNFAGELGIGNTERSEVPVLVAGGALTGEIVTEITTGSSFTCALIAGGTVSCWGENNSGQLGTGDENDSNIPVLVDGGSLAGKRVIELGVGTAHACALLSDGTVSCWGRNRYGQLGIGNNTKKNLPTSSDRGALNLRTVTQITLGSYHTCALVADGSLVCWGFNRSGQLGRGNNSNTNAAVAVVWPKRATAVEKPTISGSPIVGRQLVANKGRWTGTPVPSFTYQWYSCTAKIVSATRSVPPACETIPDSDQPTLTLAEAQRGKFIVIAVTGTSKTTAATRWLSKSTSAVN